MSHKSQAKNVFILCLIAAVTYNSWPLGYILNYPVAHNQLASELERVGSQYYQVFILLDIITALLLIAAGVLIEIDFRRLRKYTSFRIVIAGLLVFGILTAVSALLPSECTITPILKCGLNHGNGLGLDGLISAIAALGLFVGLVSVNVLNYCHTKINKLKWLNLIVTIAWSVNGLVFIYFAAKNQWPYHFLQQIFLIITGLSISIVGLNLYSLDQIAKGGAKPLNN